MSQLKKDRLIKKTYNKAASSYGGQVIDSKK